MITKAKVSLASVKAFSQAAIDSRDFSFKFDRGILCIEQLMKSFSELEQGVMEKIKTMQGSKDKLAITMRSIEEIIARLTAQINELQDKASGMENELASMSPSYTTTDENGEEHEVPNPAYVALEAEISAVYSEIASVQEELFPHEQRLDRAHFVNSKLSSHIDAANSTAYALSEKQNQCKQLMTELDDIKNSNSRKSTVAVDNLKKIEQQVAAYMRTKMSYDMGKGSSGLAGNGAVNINININKTTVINEDRIQRLELNDEYIKEHQIKLDSENHINEFEGKKFGGKYNSYKERIDGTSKESPILGRYDGERGESKYIPSNRNAEGIVVIGILKKYGVDGIEYRNGEPDFEVCAESVVKIEHMTEFRYDYEAPKGVLGNFTQADIECAKAWNFEEKDGRSNWEPRDVLNYRKANGLTWHEKCDTETMVMVRSEINAYFKHVGGCSECRLRDLSADEGGFDE